MRTSAGPIEEYIQAQPETVRPTLAELALTIRKAAPGAEEKMSYGIPTFYLDGNLVHFACFKNHVGFYPTPSAISAFAEDLKKYKTAKGSVQFPLNEPLPLKLISRIVKSRVAETRSKSAVTSAAAARKKPNERGAGNPQTRTTAIPDSK